MVFAVGEKIPDAKLIHLGEGEHKHVHADGSICEHGEHDPHVWLGPEHAQLMVGLIAKKLGDLRPEHKAGFDERAAAYRKELSDLHSYGKKAFEAKKNRRVILHARLPALLRRGVQARNRRQHSAQGRAEARPAAGQLAKLCKEKDVHVIVVEPQYSKASAETLAAAVLPARA